MAEAAQIIDDETRPDDGQITANEDDMREACRIVEALVFASTAPVEESELAKHIPDGLDLDTVMQELRSHYEGRGINLVRVAKKWTFRTAADLGWLLSRETTQQKKLSRAALETLAIVAYHQPVTRADIEEIRGVAISKGTLDVLIETGWVRLRGRRKSPGRPVTYGTTEDFLLHFGLEQINDLPGLEELKGAGMFDGRLPPGFGVPTPNDNPDLAEDEDPLEDSDLLDLALEDGESDADASAADDEEMPAAGDEGLDPEDVLAAEPVAQAGDASADVEAAEVETAEVEDPGDGIAEDTAADEADGRDIGPAGEGSKGPT